LHGSQSFNKLIQRCRLGLQTKLGEPWGVSPLIILESNIDAHVPGPVQATESYAAITSGNRGISAAELVRSLVLIVFREARNSTREFREFIKAGIDTS